ncbi:MAG: aldehyde dehydrogenase family protein [Cytophagales bacterium]|nr:aldehyde dehydrogenase family protein [Cytophagales bacterium]
MRIINPATEELLKEVNEDTSSTLQEKLSRLQRAQSGWYDVPLEQRISVAKRFSALLEENTETLSVLLTSEVGKPLQQSRNEVEGARQRIQWLTENAVRYLSDEIMTEAKGLKEVITYEPLGVVCNISAWNYPYLVGINVFVPALLAGNGVLYKPSEYATLTGLEIERLWREAGLPPDLFLTGVGGKSTGEALLDMDFDGYFFTGSYRTGKYIYEKVSARMIPCQCELGGKDPLYVADDVVDIKAIAAATADGAFYNNGQSCCAVERIYVHEKVYDRYVTAFLEEVRGYKTGNPEAEGTYIGPLTRPEHLNYLEEQVLDAVKLGAAIRIGGKKAGGKGFFFEPTVLTEVSHQMALMREESFGPVIGIMKVKDDEEAIQGMADTAYGLTASVYSADEQRARKILKRLDTGTGYWNCCDRVSAAVPWSGRKHSGIGSTLSHAGLRAFTRPKSLHLKSL